MNKIPSGFHTVNSYFAVKGAVQFIDFLKHAFNAEEISRVATPDGNIMNAELKVGDSMVLIGEARNDGKLFTAMLYLYVNDTDVLYHQAIQAGGISVMEPNDREYGDRVAAIEDFAGNQWWIATRQK